MGSGPKTTTTTVDPWTGMPDFVKDAFKSDIAFREGLLDAATSLGERQLLDMNPEELAAYEDFLGSADNADALASLGYDAAGKWTGDDALAFHDMVKESYGFEDDLAKLGGYEHGYEPGAFDAGYTPTEYSSGYEATTYDPRYEATEYDPMFEATDYTGKAGYDASKAEGATPGYTGDRLTALLGDKDWNLDYTDAVVDTTLSGMQRQAERDRLLREGRQAATGGISNTRSAVEDALAKNLTAESMAEVEARLRDDAQRFATDSLFRQAEALDSSDQFKGNLKYQYDTMGEEARRFAATTALEELGMTSAEAKFLSEQGLTAQELADASKRFLSDQGLTAQELTDASAQFLSNINLDEQELTDASARAASDYALDEQKLTDDASRFLAGMNLDTKELEDMATRYGLDFNADMLGRDNAALADAMGYDADMAQLWEGFADSGMRRDSAIYDIMKSFGGEMRSIDQGRSDAPYANIDWLSGVFTGSQNKGAVPVGNTTTQTTPGNSALQNILGVGTSLAGAWLASDENVKEDMAAPEGSALKKLSGLKSKEYRYKEGHGHTRDRTTGLVAQDAEKSGITGVTRRVNGTLAIDMYPLLSTVVDAVNELNEIVATKGVDA